MTASNKKQLVLIAEDDFDNRHLLSEFLRIDGYVSICAENGKVALDLFKENRNSIGLCLIDANMPVMDGFDCIRGIRGEDSELPIFLLSGEDSILPIGELADLRITRRFEKPFDWTELRKFVSDTLKNS